MANFLVDKYKKFMKKNDPAEVQFIQQICSLSFEDLKNIPIELLKQYLPKVKIATLSTSQTRRDFLESILPFIENADDWDDIFGNMIASVSGQFEKDIESLREESAKRELELEKLANELKEKKND